MSAAKGELLPLAWLKNAKPFAPCVIYWRAMGTTMYLNEDCSYVSDRVDRTLDILWHPYDREKVVGVQLWGLPPLLERHLHEMYRPWPLAKALCKSVRLRGARLYHRLRGLFSRYR